MKVLYSFKFIVVLLLSLIIIGLSTTIYFGYKEILSLREEIKHVNSSFSSADDNFRKVHSEIDDLSSSVGEIDTLRQMLLNLEQTISDIEFDVSRIYQAFRY